MLSAIDISTSALVAHRRWMDVISANIANANSTQSADGAVEPFRRRFVTMAVGEAGAPAAEEIGPVSFQVNIDQTSDFRRQYQPGHPHADADGYVLYPNINVIEETVNMMVASRAYEANVAAIEISEEMSEVSFRILA